MQEISSSFSAPKAIPGPDANLPGYIHERMVKLKFNPTLTELSKRTGVPVSTLRENLNGLKRMKLSTAVKIATCLSCDLTELVKNAELR